MKKTIIKIISGYSLLLLVALIFSLIVDDLLYKYIPQYKYINSKFIFVMIIPTLFVFLLLIFHLNKSYKELLTFWKITLISSTISLISSHIYYFGFHLYAYYEVYKSNIRWDYYFNSISSTYYVILSYSVVLIIECLIILILYKRLFSQKNALL